MLLRYLGWRKRKRDDHTLSYADTLATTAFESIEAIVRERMIFYTNKYFQDDSREFDEFR